MSNERKNDHDGLLGHVKSRDRVLLAGKLLGVSSGNLTRR